MTETDKANVNMKEKLAYWKQKRGLTYQHI